MIVYSINNGFHSIKILYIIEGKNAPDLHFVKKEKKILFSIVYSHFGLGTYIGPILEKDLSNG
jgi:hypothetical protein